MRIRTRRLPNLLKLQPEQRIQRKVLAVKKFNSKYLARFTKGEMAMRDSHEIANDELKSVQRNAAQKKNPCNDCKEG